MEWKNKRRGAITSFTGGRLACDTIYIYTHKKNRQSIPVMLLRQIAASKAYIITNPLRTKWPSCCEAAQQTKHNNTDRVLYLLRCLFRAQSTKPYSFVFNPQNKNLWVMGAVFNCFCKNHLSRRAAPEVVPGNHDCIFGVRRAFLHCSSHRFQETQQHHRGYNKREGMGGDFDKSNRSRRRNNCKG